MKLMRRRRPDVAVGSGPGGIAIGVLACTLLLAARGVPAARARSPQMPVPEAPVFLVPQVRCQRPPRGESVGPTGVGLLLAAIDAAPDVAGNYLDLARCHLTSGNPSRLADAEALLMRALSLIQAKAAASLPAPIGNRGGPLRVGGAIPAPPRLRDAAAVYPAAARAAGVSGVVFLDAVIDPQGTVVDTRVLGSIPELDAAAQAAVGQWTYAPTVVEGQAVTVVKLVSVKFSATSGTTPADGVDITRFHDARGEYGDAEGALTQTLAMVRDLRSRAAPRSGMPVRLPDGSFADVTAPLKIVDALPDYPASARNQRLQGLVTIEATIGKDGSVRNARVIRSVPGLDDAALEAVRQWRYTPVVLNGEPVNGVVLTVTVSFAL